MLLAVTKYEPAGTVTWANVYVPESEAVRYGAWARILSGRLRDPIGAHYTADPHATGHDPRRGYQPSQWTIVSGAGLRAGRKSVPTV